MLHEWNDIILGEKQTVGASALENGVPFNEKGLSVSLPRKRLGAVIGAASPFAGCILALLDAAGRESVTVIGIQNTSI